MCAHKRGKQIKLGEGEVRGKKAMEKDVTKESIIRCGVKGSLDLVETAVSENCVYYGGIERMSGYV